MLQYVLNVRQSQLNEARNVVRIYRTNLFKAWKLIGRHVLIYAPRGEEDTGYQGLAEVVDVHPDPDHPNFIRVEIGAILRFSVTLTPKMLYDAGDINDAPFYTYSHAIRAAPSFEVTRIAALEPLFEHRPSGWHEDTSSRAVEGAAPKRALSNKIIRSRILRFQMLQHYGPSCVFTLLELPSLDGLHFAVQQGHLWPLEYGGPDVLQNILPMSGDVNWLWDNGLISLKNDGTPLVASGASQQVLGLLRNCTRIRFPKDPRAWPQVEYLERHRDMVFEKNRAEARLAFQRLNR
ncbi:hypothetical protein ASD83_15160 [Devosia sp. Root685]|uniref:HNH endonuclease signature motif containing protein n=1 Tax=Devosia sp. Root685 TaxID=1736587 RepID=UPI0006FA7B3C|nr:HNH endonuclease [Devosia sp. Root685]KRA98351.1 hypothetical protein ASD83_15160 [Devosia sp. Root685]